MIRVLQMIATLDASGAETQMARLCLRMDPREFAVGVCALTRGGPLEGPLAEGRIPVWILRKSGRWDVGVLRRIRGVLREFRPDIVHTWLPTANTLGRAAALFGPARLVISERAVDAWKGPLRRGVDRLLARRTDAILCNAEAVRNFLVRRIGLRGDRITVIRNGLDLAAFDAQAAGGTPRCPDRLVVAAVARLEPQKGMPYLIRAFAATVQRFPASELWIAGDGPDRAALEAQAQGVAGVRFLGRRADVPALLSGCDVFALPSLWEGLPNAALEAMAARLPVVATRVDGTPEAVIHEETGLLVPPRDADALAQALARLMGNAELRQRMGAAGRRRVAEVFTMERMVGETEAVYRRILEAR